MASLLKCGISLFLIEAHWHQLVYLPPSYGWGNRVMEAARARAKSRAVMPLRQRRAEVSKAVLDKLTCLLAAAQRCWRTVSASASLSSAGAGTSAQQHIGGGCPLSVTSVLADELCALGHPHTGDLPELLLMSVLGLSQHIFLSSLQFPHVLYRLSPWISL